MTHKSSHVPILVESMLSMTLWRGHGWRQWGSVPRTRREVGGGDSVGVVGAPAGRAGQRVAGLGCSGGDGGGRDGGGGVGRPRVKLHLADGRPDLGEATAA